MKGLKLVSLYYYFIHVCLSIVFGFCVLMRCDKGSAMQHYKKLMVTCSSNKLNGFERVNNRNKSSQSVFIWIN